MQASSVAVCTGSRLHFGLFSFGCPTRRKYGGVGLMIDQPAVRVRIVRASRFDVTGAETERVRRVVQRWLDWRGSGEPPRCTIETSALAARHVGFGSGTQLGCAVAAGLSALEGQPITSAQQLAEASGRGERSAIGTHGFLRGGLIIDDGKDQDQIVGALLAREELPAAWRVLLIWPRQVPRAEQYSGQREQQAFEQMPEVSLSREAELRSIAVESIVPAARVADFEQFSRAVFLYNQLAGRCYETLQGGVYANPRVEQLIHHLRSWGIEGVGQSSWGPLIFALAPSADAAEAWQQRIAQEPAAEGHQCQIAAVANGPATIDVNERNDTD